MNTLPAFTPEAIERIAERRSKPCRKAKQVVAMEPRNIVGLWTLPELAIQAQVCRRFLELEISRGRLRVTRLSNRVRVRNSDWEKYLEACAAKDAPAVDEMKQPELSAPSSPNFCRSAG